MSTDQEPLTAFERQSPHERALAGRGAAYRGRGDVEQAPTGDHGGGACENCGATEQDMDGIQLQWWRVFAPAGGPERCPQCMNGLQQDHAAVALGERVPEDMHGVRD